jgi:peptidoglycan/xylan/chitin deacetylase (PgdA/CDA1 family)
MNNSRQPAVLIGIDTEADDQWSAEGRQRLSVRNAERLPALQVMFDELGVRPTYVVTHEMATRPESRDVLRALHAGGRCEIGTHLHPWTSPPFRPEDLSAHTYPHNLPRELLDRQLTELTAVIEAELGVHPTTYRAGRNGFDGRTLPILERLGYTVDTSVDPLFNEKRKGGMVFAGAPVDPYHPDYADVRRPGASKILEIPISAATLPGLPKTLESLYARLKPIPWRGALKRLGLRP